MSGTANGVDKAAAASKAMSTSNGIERLRDLEALFLGGPVNANEAKCFSTETLLDILLVLFNECLNSSLRKEKTLTDFIELGRAFFPILNFLRENVQDNNSFLICS